MSFFLIYTVRQVDAGFTKFHIAKMFQSSKQTSFYYEPEEAELCN